MSADRSPTNVSASARARLSEPARRQGIECQLVKAARAIIERRVTPLPSNELLALSAHFLSAPERAIRWRAFQGRGRLAGPADTARLADESRRFLGPIRLAAPFGEAFELQWLPGGPWAAPARSAEMHDE
jgi:hypothetical protein